MSELFRRSLSLIVGAKETNGAFIGRQVDGLRVSFRATKSLEPKANTIEISAWNLAPETRAAAQVKDAGVMLSAGYGDAMRLIFVGDMDQVSHERQGPDWVTTMQAGDGLAATRKGRVFESFSRAANPLDVVMRLASEMGVGLGNAVKQLGKGGVVGTFTEFTKGYTAAGPVHEEMNRLARATGFEWSVQDGQLQILEPGKPCDKEAVVLSSTSGLIGSPTLGIKAGAGKKKLTVLKARALLNGDIAPGRLVQVEAEQVKGWYRVETVQLVGDTHGGDWFTDLEAKPA